MWEVRAQIGAPGTELAITQKCTCHVTDRCNCLVHGEVDAYAVELIFYGRRMTVLSTKSYVKQPIKREIKFFRYLYSAVGKWGERTDLLDTILLRKERNGTFRKLTSEEMEDVMDIQDAMHLEICGI